LFQPIKTVSTKIIGTFLFATSILLCIWGQYDSLGNQYLQSAIARSLTTFATARILNGVISVAQQTEVNVTPMGIGLVLSPAQILDPLNDLVEQFSSVMLLSSAVLVGQALVSELTSSSGFSYFTVSMCLLALFLVWIPKELTQFQQLLIKFTLLLIIIRFLIPSYATVSGVVHKSFFESSLDSANAEMKGVSDQINEINNQSISKPNENNPDERWTEWIEKKLEDTVATIKSPLDIIQAKVDTYKKIAEDSVKHIVRLIALFILETVIFPILFSWILILGIRNISGFLSAGVKHKT